MYLKVKKKEKEIVGVRNRVEKEIVYLKIKIKKSIKRDN